MDKLYPIIRRQRRPLLQENPEMRKAETLKPVVVAAGHRVESVPATPAPEQPKTSDAKTVSQDESY